MVVCHDLVVELVIGRIGFEGIFKAAHGGPLDLAGFVGGGKGGAPLPQEFIGMTKADAIEFLDELDRVAGGAATHAVEQPFCRRHDE